MFNLLKRLVKGHNKNQGKASKSESASYEELRLYARYPLPYKNMGKIKVHSNGQEGQIINLSYGGLLVHFNDPWTEEINKDEGDSFSAEIEILGQKSQTDIQFVHVLNREKNLSGFSFQHRNVETLVFLREILEHFRIGSSLRTPPIDLIEKKYQGKWKIFRGEGPTDLRINPASNPKDYIATINFRQGNSYCELQYKNEKFQTGRSFDLTESGDTIVQDQTSVLDPEIFRHAVEILIGATSNEQAKEHSKTLLAKAMDQLP